MVAAKDTSAVPRSSGWQRTLRNAWQRRGLLAWLLWPLSRVYAALLHIRVSLYRLGVLQARRLPVPVVVVGNVLLGGTGKTPVVMALVTYLQSQGWQVGVISRGYGRQTAGCLEVSAASRAQDVGDEPTLIHHRTQVPVFVAESRVEAGQALLHHYPQVNVLVSDDGLQHLPLARDVEIGVFDDRGVGNGWLLPAGPLREPWPRALDLTLHTGQRPAFAGFQGQRQLANYALRADGGRVSLSSLCDQPVVALAAIAQPEVFFAMLRAQGLTLRHVIALPDHFDFSSSDRFDSIDYQLLCTEKDAVKLWPLQPAALAVPLEFTLPPSFWSALDAQLPTRPDNTTSATP
jgi:tetraacyldisaccharide 4'-kinase